MNFLDFLPTIAKVIDKLIPDPQAKAQAQLDLLKLQQAGEFKELDADLALKLEQIKVNAIEAQSPDFFRGGWRPFVGWVCGTGSIAARSEISPACLSDSNRPWPAQSTASQDTPGDSLRTCCMRSARRVCRSRRACLLAMVARAAVQSNCLILAISSSATTGLTT